MAFKENLCDLSVDLLFVLDIEDLFRNHLTTANPFEIHKNQVILSAKSGLILRIRETDFCRAFVFQLKVGMNIKAAVLLLSCLHKIQNT